MAVFREHVTLAFAQGCRHRVCSSSQWRCGSCQTTAGRRHHAPSQLGWGRAHARTRRWWPTAAHQDHFAYIPRPAAEGCPRWRMAACPGNDQRRL